jgi:hypothetical protein
MLTVVDVDWIVELVDNEDGDAVVVIIEVEAEEVNVVVDGVKVVDSVLLKINNEEFVGGTESWSKLSETSAFELGVSEFKNFVKSIDSVVESSSISVETEVLSLYSVLIIIWVINFSSIDVLLVEDVDICCKIFITHFFLIKD